MSIRNPLPKDPAPGREFATLGGGCFWCLEAVFEELQGVIDVESGYAGGHVANPTYRQVCDGITGHAEVVRIEFDPRQIGYREILEVFFAVHDPTTLNRQGGDVGEQYRSAIFYHSEAQRQTAEAVQSRVAASGKWKGPIVTQIVAASRFYPGEDYHQAYLQKNPGGYTCHYLRD